MPKFVIAREIAGAGNLTAANAKCDVHWKLSYANAEQTRTFCIYEATSDQEVRDPTAANSIPVNTVMEVPVTLLPK